MGYFKIDLYTKYVYVHDWERSFEIARSFIEGQEQGWMVGYSFNLYFGDRPLSHITVRFNFVDYDEGKQNAEEIINHLIGSGLIVAKGEWSTFEVSPSVTRATEVSTKCAFAFKSWMDRNPEVLSIYVQNPQNRIQFIARFLILLLQQLGFQAYLEEYPMSDSDMNLIRNCVDYCVEQVRQGFKQELDIIFMERVIHHFLNCVHISINEETFVHGKIHYWDWLGNLLENRTL